MLEPDEGKPASPVLRGLGATDDVKALYEEFSAVPGVKISPQLLAQDYGMTEFDVMDLNGYRLVFAQPIPARYRDFAPSGKQVS